MSDIFPQPKSVDSTLSDALGHYVYLLIDPRNEAVFYVGKGVGGRCFEHDYAEEGARKAARFAEIKAAGLEVKVEIVRHSMATKEEAFLVESAVIDVYGIENLTNKVKGHGATDFGRATLAELAARYAPEEAEILHRVVFVKLADAVRGQAVTDYGLILNSGQVGAGYSMGSDRFRAISVRSGLTRYSEKSSSVSSGQTCWAMAWMSSSSSRVLSAGVNSL
jgi:hypothetical protein